MKTFEERYTEWIDGQLAGADLAAFEGELASRAAVGDAQADKAQAHALRGLLRAHLEAPPLANADFFSHQLRERIEQERAAVQRTEKAPVARPFSWFSWSLPRFAAATAAVLFVGTALYYGMIPPYNNGESKVAKAAPAPVQTPAPALAVNPAVPDASPANAPQGPAPARSSEVGPMVKNDVSTSPPLPMAPPSEAPADLEARGVDNATSVTPLNFKVPNKPQSVSVLWTNNLDYLPNVPDGDDGSPALAPAPTTP
jgi:hypothetical protein